MRLVEQRLEGQACGKGLELELDVVVVEGKLGWLVGGMEQPLAGLEWRVVVGVAEAEHHTAESASEERKGETNGREERKAVGEKRAVNEHEMDKCRDFCLPVVSSYPTGCC